MKTPIKTLLGAGLFVLAQSAMTPLMADENGLPDPGFEIVAGRTALLVADPQNDFLSPDGVAWGVVGNNALPQASSPAGYARQSV